MADCECAGLRDRIIALEIHRANEEKTMDGALAAIEKLTSRIETLTSVMDKQSSFESGAKWVLGAVCLGIGYLLNKVHLGL